MHLWTAFSKGGSQSWSARSLKELPMDCALSERGFMADRPWSGFVDGEKKRKRGGGAFSSDTVLRDRRTEGGIEAPLDLGFFKPWHRAPGGPVSSQRAVLNHAADPSSWGISRPRGGMRQDFPLEVPGQRAVSVKSDMLSFVYSEDCDPPFCTLLSVL